MRKIVWTYGLIGGGIIIIFFIIGMLTQPEELNCDMGVNQLVGFASMFLVGGVTIFVGIKRYRDKYHEGPLKFGKAFLVGLYMSLVASGVYTIGWMSYTFTDQGAQWGDQYALCQTENINAQPDLDASQKQEKVKKLKDQMEAYKNPVYRTGITITEILPVYLLISLVAAGFLMTRKKAV